MITKFIRSCTLPVVILSIGLIQPATAAPDAGTFSGTMATFSGNQSSGVSSDSDFTIPTTLTLNVINLTQGIIPLSGTMGIKMFGAAPGGAGGYNADTVAETPGNGTAGTAGYNLTLSYDGSANITTTGTSATGAFGIGVQSKGGNGGVGGSSQADGDQTAGAGGVGAVGGDIVINPTTMSLSGTIQTSGSNGYGIYASSSGGNGGSGGFAGDISATGGGGNTGGNGGTVTVNNYNTIITSGSSSSYANTSSGIFAESIAGAGGNGGEAEGAKADGGNGGSGGTGGQVTVNNYGNITTTGNFAQGIYVQSLGGAGGSGGSGGGASGAGGSGGSSTSGGEVDVTDYAAILTSGVNANGIFAQSLGGVGGGGGSGAGIAGFGGGGANSAGDGGTVNVTLESGGSITTGNTQAYGILAQSIGGGGGSGGSGSGLAGFGASGDPGGTGGNVTVNSAGIINVSGSDSIGIFAQSVGGGGGQGGSSGGAYSVGGNGSTTSDGGTVTVGNTSGITATSNAIFAQSVGGGGGNGGSSGGWFSFGGSGGGGGDASAVNVTSNGDLTTTQANASAIFAQSLGGGGGNGGNSTAVGAFGSVSIGGDATLGGSGANVTVGVNPNTIINPVTGRIMTSGNNASGIQAQSVGGGGGNGGFAVSASAGPGVDVSLGIGGTGGDGGGAGEVDVYYNGSLIRTTGTNANGIFAQSVGGGGGSGGFSVAVSMSTGVSGALSFGGTGGTGGDGGVVNVGNTANPTGGEIETTGDHSYGILAQSLGGGGGNGGFSLAGTLTMDGGAALSFGGSGGVAGTGTDVTIYSASTVSTQGNDSHGIFAQSVGGGGGSGGGSVAGGVSSGGDVDLSFGGKGGGGGDGGAVTLNSSGPMVTTAGNNSDGLLAQSVGGGGGNGGFSVAGGISGGPSVNFGMGGSGGTASSGSSVTLVNSSAISTGGTDSSGIVAQSLGGGGGSGGFDVSGGISGASAAIDAGIGGTGGAGGDAGNVSVTNSGSMIMTGTGGVGTGDRSYGILAQSVGGGGGAGGFSVAGGISDGPAVNFSMGGGGGTGGDAGNVQLLSNGNVITNGNNAHAIFAQSLGGGGGAGGFSVTGGISNSSASLSASIGGTGAGGGSSGSVAVGATISSTSSNTLPIYIADPITGNIYTYGNHSYGILAQSIAGSGGDGGFSIAGGISESADVNFSMGGKGGSGGAAGDVVLDSGAVVSTTGSNSHAIFAQSLGGGGGSGGFSITGDVSAGGGAIGASIGGNGSAGGDAATVTLISSGSMITTMGTHSYGLLAQSVGGGGGDGGFSITGNATNGNESAAVGFSMGGSGTGGGTGSIVYLNSSSSIQTSGVDSFGIFAQSLGGGGGSGGFSVTGGITTGSSSAAVSVSIGGKAGGGGNANNVTVISTGSSVSTGSDRSTAIVAQSLGGGGGAGGFSVAGSISTGTNVNFSLGGSGGGGGSAGTVTLSSSSAITTTGTDSDGILAQSVGGGGGAGGFSVAGGITTGSNTPTVNASIGGGGGSGGTGSMVTVTSSGSSIHTGGDYSDGIIAQSVGGGGGAGGFSVAGGFSKVNAVDFSLGGSGGPGNNAGDVFLDNSSNITTTGNLSLGILAQSVGGGGGNGGFSVAASVVSSGTAIDSTTTSITASIGGKGGGGGTAGNVTVGNLAALTGTITTSGTQSTGLVAQSIGGGGGNGGFAIAGSIDTKGGSKSIAFALGGGGGGGSSSGTVAVNSAMTITTNDENSIGILAQSVGGGGGNGGFGVAGAVSVGGTDMQTSMSISAAVGGGGGSGNTGNTVTVTNSGAVTTMADDSTAILAQSVGGGGGNGGMSLGISGITNANSKSKNIALNLSVGGGGGSGNDAGNVTVTNTGDIVTNGGDSDGIAAQSIGGGGGNGGSAKTFTMLVDTPGSTVANLPGIGDAIAKKFGLDPGSQSNNYEVTIAVGGTGGSSGNGGMVTVSSTSNITTTGLASNGISAQSIGGGGGNGGDGLFGTGTPADDATIADNSSIAKNLSIAVGGNAGSSGGGGVVTITESGTISTQGLYSNGIFAQSVGGGGGAAYLTVTGTEQAGNVGPTGGSATIGMTGKVGIGGAGGAAGSGSSVTVTVTGGSISTAGNGASGISAQSIGGGGGMAGDVDRGLKAEGINFGIGLAFGRSGGGAGNGGNVVVTSTANITTMGDNSFGIFAQSVGGGGGEIGSLGIGPEIPIALFIGSVGGSGTSGTVTVNETGNITTSGSDANGIMAQSAAGSGTAGNATITLAGNITTTGTSSDGIYVQSVSQSAGNNGNDLVTITSGSVEASSGTDSAGVRLVDGNNNQLTNHGTIETADMISGSAIIAQMISGSATLSSTMNEAVDNFGVVIGSVDIGTGSNSFTHEAGALLESGSIINIGAGNYFYNSGTISPGGVGTIESTTLTGNFTQTGSATWYFDINSNFTSDLFAISGTANLGSYNNTVNLNELAVPTTTGTYTLITAASGLTGTFAFGTMSGTTMPAGLTYTLTNSDTREKLNLITSTGTFYWRGAADNAWNGDFVSGSSNWTSDVAGNNFIYGTPGVAVDVVFSSTNAATTNRNTVLGTDFSINSLTVNDPNAVTIGGSNVLTIAAASGTGITVNPGAGPATLSTNIELAGDQSWTNNSSNLLEFSGSNIITSSPGNNLTVEGSGTTRIDAVIATNGGSLTKDGTGMLAIFNSNTYSGGTTLKNGVLIAGNAFALGVGNVNLTGGILQTTNNPATSPTTPLALTVGGTYMQTSPATLQLRIIGPSGVNDKIAATGPAILGGTFMPDYSVTGYNPIPPAGNYTDAFQVLTSVAGVSGTFSAYVDPHYNPNNLLRWEPFYNPNDVMLEWVQHQFTSLTNLTFNQHSVADAIDAETGLPPNGAPSPYNQSTGPAITAHPGMAAGIIFLDNEPLANLPHDFDLIGPEALTSIFEIGRSFADVQDNNIEDRLAAVRSENTPPPEQNVSVGFMVADDKSTVDLRDEDDKKVTAPPAPEKPRWDLFMEGSGDFVHVDSDLNAQGYQLTTGGVTVGADFRANEHFVIGLMAGYANTGATLTQGGSVDVDSGRVGIYSTLYGNGFYVNTLAAGGYNSYDTHRVGLGLGGVATGSTDGEEFDGMISGGYELHQGRVTIGPVVSARYTYVAINSFDELGTLFPLHIEGQNQSSLATTAGFKISSTWNLGGVVITPMMTAAWEHEFLSTSYALDSQFANGAGNIFTVRGPALGRDGVVVNAGFNVQWTPRFGTYLYYNGELGRKNYELNSVTGGAKINF